jgi:hypothetical protein
MVTLSELIEQLTTELAAWFNNGYCWIEVFFTEQNFALTSGDGIVYEECPTVEEVYAAVGEYASVPCWKLRHLSQDEVM